MDKNKSRLAQDAENMLVECALRNAIHKLRAARSSVDLIDADTLEAMLAKHIREHGSCAVTPTLADISV